MFRYRKSYKHFLKHKNINNCALCELHNSNILEETDYIIIVENKFPYDIWEHCDVIDHLMIVPKQHVKGLAELSNETRLAIINAVSKFESAGYDIYARAVDSNQRSVAGHQHTHLIRTTGEAAKASLYLSKPYIVAKIGS